MHTVGDVVVLLKKQLGRVAQAQILAKFAADESRRVLERLEKRLALLLFQHAYANLRVTQIARYIGARDRPRARYARVAHILADDAVDLSAHFLADTIRTIKEVNPQTTVEVLIPDFRGRLDLVDQVVDAAPEIISHNMETVRRISPQVRSAAKYDVSLSVLRRIAERGVVAKTGIMVGLGETEDEVLELMDDVLLAGVSVLTIGQYLQPSRKNIPVSEYVTPECFEYYRQQAVGKGFKKVESAPLVRSSYHAEKHI